MDARRARASAPRSPRVGRARGGARSSRRRIRALPARGGDYATCAVLYRTNAQSRALETALRRACIPYEIVGGVRVLRAPRGQGRARLPAPGREPARRRGVPAGVEHAARAASASARRARRGWRRSREPPPLEPARRARREAIGEPRRGRARSSGAAAIVARLAERRAGRRRCRLLDVVLDSAPAIARRSRRSDAEAEARRENVEELVARRRVHAARRPGSADARGLPRASRAGGRHRRLDAEERTRCCC